VPSPWRRKDVKPASAIILKAWTSNSRKPGSVKQGKNLVHGEHHSGRNKSGPTQSGRSYWVACGLCCHHCLDEALWAEPPGPQLLAGRSQSQKEEHKTAGIPCSIKINLLKRLGPKPAARDRPCQVSASAWAAHFVTSSCALCSPLLRRLPFTVDRQLLAVLYQWICETIPAPTPAASGCPLALVIAFTLPDSESRHAQAQQGPNAALGSPAVVSLPRPSTGAGPAVVTIDTETDGHQHRALKVSPPADGRPPVSAFFGRRLRPNNAPAKAPRKRGLGQRCGSFRPTSWFSPMPTVVGETTAFCCLKRWTSGGGAKWWASIR